MRSRRRCGKSPNLALLLQLAKLYRLEHGFVNLMRFFRKPRRLAPPDPVPRRADRVSLLSRTPAPRSRRAPSPRARAERRAAPSVRETPRFTLPVLAAAAIAVVLSARGGLLRGGCRTRPERCAPRRAWRGAPRGQAASADETARADPRTRRRRRGERPAKAWDLYAEAAARTPRLETRAALYRTMTDVARASGDEARVLKSLDGLAAVPSARGEALLRRGEYFESLRRNADAVRAYEEARAGPDAGPARTATLRLAQSAERGRDALRAQTLYEEILREAPASSEALPARVGLASLYRASGRDRDAHRLYEDILRVAPPGGDARALPKPRSPSSTRGSRRRPRRARRARDVPPPSA